MPGIGGNLFNRSPQSRTNSQHEEPQFSQNVAYPPMASFPSFSSSGPIQTPILQDRVMGSSSFGHPSTGTDFNAASRASGSNPSLTQLPSSVSTMNPGWGGPMFDPSDPALFNFDLASMNFGSHYGALEFGMLGHMATGVGDTPSDAGTHRGSIGHPNESEQYSGQLSGFGESPSGNQPFGYGDTMMHDWSKSQNFFNQQFQRKSDAPHAFAIESNAAPFTSPETEYTESLKFEESPTLHSTVFKGSALPLLTPTHQTQSSTPNSVRQLTQISTPQLKAKSQIPAKSSRRLRDPSAIYTTVTSPHPYTTGFHALIAYLQRRFASTPAKTLAIAKSLASIRPSFIATTKTLNRDDLIFMEKCFQRTLWEYEGFIESVGTPTIVARRTGEIAAVGKEFEILTGWTKKILLGRSPNLNVNRGRSPGSVSTGPGSGANTTGRGTGINTPIQRAGFPYDGDWMNKDPQPVFLAELLDDDSVVTFYEDFARLAFGDSRGSVMGRVKLLKYQTREDEIAINLKREADSRQELGQGPNISPKNSARDTGQRQRSNSTRKSGELKEGISGEKGMQKLGAADGKVDCTFCWTVKRDVFDIPMLIVMNVSFSSSCDFSG